MTKNQTMALRASAILWMIWGIVHILAGVMVISLAGADMFSGIGDAVNPEELASYYHPIVDAVVNQHGWNLGWIGVWTAVGSVLIWRGNMTAIWTTAAVGGLADIGYFVFIDLAGFANFFPGGLMTYICASAIILSGWVWFSRK